VSNRIASVLRKEVMDNFRDRRSLSSALAFGPLFGPVLFSIMITLSVERHTAELDAPLRLPVAGAEHAPNLIEYLHRGNAEIVDGPADLAAAETLVKDGREELVLIVPPGFGKRFRAGDPAVVRLVTDSADSSTAKSIQRARALLADYSRTIGVMRLQARGVSPTVMAPLVIEDVDVATPAGRSILLLGMMTYFIIFSMLMGGLYLAIDTTAGERERGSLEPLLTLPVRRGQLIVGKILATCVYMVASLAITLIAFHVCLRYVPLDELGMRTNFGPAVIGQIFVIMLPFALLGAAMMTCVASFTRTYKEAQTYLTALLLVPTLPILFAALNTMRPALGLMGVPSLSQHLIITELMKAEPVSGAYVAVSILSTLAFGLLLTWLAALLYRREGILG
jgi:sodium transport system permease protein